MDSFLLEFGGILSGRSFNPSLAEVGGQTREASHTGAVEGATLWFGESLSAVRGGLGGTARQVWSLPALVPCLA